MRDKDTPAATPVMAGAVGMPAASIISAGLLGYGLDLWLDTAPWFMLSFIAIGFAGSLLRLYRMLSRT